MAQTKQEIRIAWNKANYKRYLVNLRFDSDTDLIAFVEDKKASGKQTTEIFREALELLKEKESRD